MRHRRVGKVIPHCCDATGQPPIARERQRPVAAAAPRGSFSLGQHRREISGRSGGTVRLQGAVTLAQVFAEQGVVSMVGEHGLEVRVTSPVTLRRRAAFSRWNDINSALSDYSIATSSDAGWRFVACIIL